MGSPKEDAERLEKATETARELLSEIHGVTKDLHTAMRDARTISAKLTEEEMRREVKSAVDKLGEATKQAMEDSVARVTTEFDKLQKLLMGRTRSDRRQGRMDVSTLIKQMTDLEEK